MASAMAGMAGFGGWQMPSDPQRALWVSGVVVGHRDRRGYLQPTTLRQGGSRFHFGVRRFHRVSSPRLISMEMNVRDVKRSQFRRSGVAQGAALPALCLFALLTGQLTNPMFAQSDQHSITAAQSLAVQSKVTNFKLPAKLQKELPPSQSSAQESKRTQPKLQTAKSEESKAKKDSGEEGTEKEKEGTGKKAVSSLILTVKLALLEDPRLFPYEIEVEAGSDEVTLAGKVSTEAEKAAAAKIASTVPTVKSVSNKLEVVKELPELIAHKPD